MPPQDPPPAETRALRHALEQVDTLKRELMKARMQAAQFKLQLTRLRTNDSKPMPREQQPGAEAWEGAVKVSEPKRVYAPNSQAIR